jgi:hypothetical protein
MNIFLGDKILIAAIIEKVAIKHRRNQLTSNNNDRGDFFPLLLIILNRNWGDCAHYTSPYHPSPREGNDSSEFFKYYIS